MESTSGADEGFPVLQLRQTIVLKIVAAAYRPQIIQTGLLFITADYTKLFPLRYFFLWSNRKTWGSVNDGKYEALLSVDIQYMVEKSSLSLWK